MNGMVVVVQYAVVGHSAEDRLPPTTRWGVKRSGAREGPAPRAQVSLLWALLCPLPGVSDLLGGADALPCPSSLGDVTVAAAVKPRAKRLRAAALR